MSVWSAIAWRLRLLRQWQAQARDTVWASEPVDVVFMSADANKTDSGNGEYVDRVLDPLRQHFEKAGLRCISVARPGSRITGQLRSHYVHTLNKKALSKQLLSSMWAPFVKLGLRNSSVADPDGSMSYELLIRHLKPRVVLCLNSTPGLCQAGYRTETPVIEVLHARGYSFPYTKEWASQPDLDLPDGILAYDDESAKAFSSRLPTLRIPNYRLEAELSLAREFSEKDTFSTQLFSSQVTHRILFTASYNPTTPLWPGGPPPELVNLVRKNSQYFLMVRVHPVMRAGPQYRRALDQLVEEINGLPNADIEWSTNAPMYSVLEKTDVHFTWNSLSAYEAADLGIRTFVLEVGHPLLSEAMADLQRAGYVLAIRSSEKELDEAIRASGQLKPFFREGEDIDARGILSFASNASEMRRARVEHQVISPHE